MLRNPSSLISQNTVQANRTNTTVAWLVCCFLAHIPLAVVLGLSQVFSKFVALVPLACSLFLLGYSQRPAVFLYSLAYITGADVLFRMTQGAWFWEQTKYSIVLLLVLGLMKFRKARAPYWPILSYLALLLPSALILIFQSDDWSWHSEAREQISFHLSGPLTLAISVLFFSSITVTKAEFQNILTCLFMPIVGMGVLILTQMGSMQDITFTGASNFSTSGGFGPNQVSAMLGLGALLCFLHVTVFEKDVWTRYFYGFLGLWFLSQAVLTFSRGGVLSALLAMFGGFAIQMTNHRLRKVVLAVGLVLMVSGYFLLPFLGEITGGALQERFSDTSTTGRWELILADLSAWEDNFLFGTGPGQSNEYHADALGRRVTAHTEYSRLIAEHGLLGLIAGIILLFTLKTDFFKAKSTEQKTVVLCLGIWASTTMLHASMRIAAISFVFGLASLMIFPKRSSRRLA